MPKIFVVIVVACVMVIAGLVLVNASLSQYVAVLISLLALIVSIVSAFKEDIFPFQPSVLFDEVVMAPTSGPSHNSVALVLPLTFINKGNGAGVIHMLALRIESEGKMKLYTPIVQVDFQKYLTGKRKLHSENITGSFNAFALSGKSTVQKYLLLSQVENSNSYPSSPWHAGIYTFRLFINRVNGGKAEEVCCLGPMQINAEMLASYSAGTGSSLCPSRAISI